MHQCPKKVWSSDNQLQRGMVGHEVAHISWCGTQAKTQWRQRSYFLLWGCSWQQRAFCTPEQPQRHPAKPYHWKRGGGQNERGGTSTHSGGSERHPPTSPTPLTKLSGLSRAHAVLEHIFLKSFTPDNVQKPAANWFCCNRPANSNCTQPTGHT